MRSAHATRTTIIRSGNGPSHPSWASPTGSTRCSPCCSSKPTTTPRGAPVYEGIEGFDYEPGYEYKLRIKAKQLAEPPQDASSVRYSLLELISKTPARSNIPDSYYPTFTMEVAPEPVSYYGELYLSVRFPEVGLNDWQRWPFRIEGFDYEQGYSYKLKVGTSVVGVDEGYYTVQYSVLEMLDKQPAQE